MTQPIEVGPKQGLLSIFGGTPDPYLGKIVILVNETTVSRAEFVAMALQTAPHATVIGSQTAGADGNVSQLVLPGGIRTSFSGLGVFYPDGRETQHVGIVPDIKARPTVMGLQREEDEVLARAIRFLTEEEYTPASLRSMAQTVTKDDYHWGHFAPTVMRNDTPPFGTNVTLPLGRRGR